MARIKYFYTRILKKFTAKTENTSKKSSKVEEHHDETFDFNKCALYANWLGFIWVYQKYY